MVVSADTNLHDALVDAFLSASAKSEGVALSQRDAAAVLADVALDTIEKWTVKDGEPA